MAEKITTKGDAPISAPKPNGIALRRGCLLPTRRIFLETLISGLGCAELATANAFLYPRIGGAPPDKGGSKQEYWVSPEGSDSNSGSREKPWRTIGKAAQTLAAGQTVIISSGVYRETLRPANSGSKGRPITFKAAEGADVVINGCETIKGWSEYGSAGVWRAKMKWSLNLNYS